jgi:hypothetical protein
MKAPILFDEAKGVDQSRQDIPWNFISEVSVPQEILGLHWILKWATNRKVPQIAFKPDWTKHAKAAPFKRNDAMLNDHADRRHPLPRAPGSRTTSATRPASSRFPSCLPNELQCMNGS